MKMEELEIEQMEVSVNENELNRKRVRLIATLLDIEILLREQEVRLLSFTQNDRKGIILKEAA
ncbi:MAG: hypothetical protein ACXVCR_07345 [Bdellovibrio sp.]